MLELLTLSGKKPIIPQGQIILETAQNWVVPAGVTSICVVLVGKGGEGTLVSTNLFRGGGGGSLSYLNNIPVTPGETLNVQINTNLIALRRVGFVLARANHGVGPVGGAAYTLGGQVSFAGGSAGSLGDYVLANNPCRATGGGGAGGYAGVGGSSPNITTVPTGATEILQNGVAGVGGGGGSGITTCIKDGGSIIYHALGGGGVGLLGQGSNGAGGSTASYPNYSGRGGSGGSHGNRYTNPNYEGTGDYGGGGSMRSDGTTVFGKAGLRIIWGEGRYFPGMKASNQPVITL